MAMSTQLSLRLTFGRHIIARLKKTSKSALLSFAFVALPRPCMLMNLALETKLSPSSLPIILAPNLIQDFFVLELDFSHGTSPGLDQHLDTAL